MEFIACSSRWRAMSSLPARKSSIACNRSISADERPAAFALAERPASARRSVSSALWSGTRRGVAAARGWPDHSVTGFALSAASDAR